MVRQFKTGGVYKCKIDIKDEAIGASFLIKVVGFYRTRRDRLQYRIFGNDTQAIELIGGTPSCVRTAAIEADEYGNDAEMVSMYFPEPSCDIYHIFISSSRVILKTGVLLFCATKLIVLARRAKESMYAPGGIGFIAAQEDFDRAAKAIYETFEQADRDAKRQCIE
jgi:hypothetical protein